MLSKSVGLSGVQVNKEIAGWGKTVLCLRKERDLRRDNSFKSSQEIDAKLFRSLIWETRLDVRQLRLTRNKPSDFVNTLL